MISSKFHNLLRDLRKDLGGGARIVVSIQHRSVDPVRILKEVGAKGLSIELSFINEELVEAIHEAGGIVFFWTIKDAKRALRLASMGVSVITTYRPDLIVPVLSYQDEADGRRLSQREDHIVPGKDLVSVRAVPPTIMSSQIMRRKRPSPSLLASMKK